MICLDSKAIPPFRFTPPCLNLLRPCAGVLFCGSVQKLVLCYYGETTMGGIFSSPSIPAPAPAPPPPTRSDPDVQGAAIDARRRLAARSGRASTILTSGQGVTDETPSTTKTLLGTA